jgi:hypothetical protein
MKTVYRLICFAACMALCAPGAVAKQPNAVFGIGTLKCDVFVSSSDDKNRVASDVMVWVQGWFSARNAGGLQMSAPKTVGGSLSHDTLREFLVSDCKENPQFEIWYVADQLYERLAIKGL